MCEFCTQHGEGKTWYLNAKNYSSDLLSDLKRRQFIGGFLDQVVANGNRKITLLEKTILRGMDLPAFVRQKLTQDMKPVHFGQVVPLEDVDRILAMARTITRVACGCKWAKERKEGRLCYAITMGPPAWTDCMDMDFFGSGEVARLENLTRAEAAAAIGDSDRQGFVHSVWTFHTPFIGAICNCEKSYCLAMRSSLNLKAPAMFRAEFVAAVDRGACSGCRACIERCPFGAIEFDVAGTVCLIDKSKCYGCGVCRPACPSDAIRLSERRADPVAAAIW
ncbi:MAG: 4Fe-4S binding protein [Acidobacteria bacterium]|jgi:NAD-dependent dihydropyrimidine dehydrogenase PreA subunit|nr:4Fe-4S binding protein [Acidobacteriota bacterium]